jgi:putative transposase
MSLTRNLLWFVCYSLLKFIELALQRWSSPAHPSLVPGTLVDLTRTPSELLLENAFLRQQINVLSRQKTRPPLTPWDRRLLVWLAHWLPGWKTALHVVQPETLLRWHRELVKLVWRSKSKVRPKVQPNRLPSATIALIRQLAQENRLWGAERIRGELLKLGIHVSKRTIQKYRHHLPRLPSGSQSWSTFVRNHAKQIWACDFIQTYDVFFRAIFVFVIIELGSRRVVYVNVTRSPTDGWVAQQWRNATPFSTGPRYLIRNNDGKYGEHFARVTASVKTLRTPVRAPRANAFCERFVGSVRRECLDYLIVLSENQLRCVLNQYVRYFNVDRPHQGINQHLPSAPELPAPVAGTIRRRDVLGGLHHTYFREAA